MIHQENRKVDFLMLLSAQINIQWKPVFNFLLNLIQLVTARTGEPFIKTFVEERQLQLVLMVDGSPSMDFGTARSKREAAAELAALLATVAQAQHDLVGLTLFGGARELSLPPQKGEAAILRVVREVLAPAGDPAPHPRRLLRPRHAPHDLGDLGESESRLATALRHQDRLSRRRALVFVIGDWLAEPAPRGSHAERALRGSHAERALQGSHAERALRRAPGPSGEQLARADWEEPFARLARRHDLIAVRVFDPFEEQLPAAGLLALEDAERGTRIEIDTGSRAVREAWAARAAARRAALAAVLVRAGVELLELSTRANAADALVRFFQRRMAGGRTLPAAGGSA